MRGLEPAMASPMPLALLLWGPRVYRRGKAWETSQETALAANSILTVGAVRFSPSGTGRHMPLTRCVANYVILGDGKPSALSRSLPFFSFCLVWACLTQAISTPRVEKGA